MDFVVEKYIFMPLFWLALRAFGALIEPFIQNRVVIDGTTNVPFTCASQNPKNINWSMYSVVNPRMRNITLGTKVLDSDFDAYVESDSKKSYVIVKIASLYTAGVYTCREEDERSAQLIVITEEPTCSFSPQSDIISCFAGQHWSLFCSIKYVANKSFVDVQLAMSSDNFSDIGGRTMKEAGGWEVTYVNAFKVTTDLWNYSSISTYRCTTTFFLANDLPRGFVNDAPDYTNVCSPTTSDPCRPSTSTKKPKNVSQKWSGEDLGENGPEESSGKSIGDSVDKSHNGSGGMSSKGIIRSCVVGIVCFRLINSGNGV